MPHVDDLLDRARRAAGAGKYAQAERYLERALGTSTDPDVRARVEITRAYVEAETGDPAGAAARCRAVLDGGGLDVLTEGKAWQQLGLILMRTGATEAAMEVLARAISVLP